MALRPYWSGTIRMSLVSLPVNIYSALNRSRQIALHEIYKKTGQRVRHQNVVDGEAVERDEIVKGYEVEKGEYVLIDPAEIARLKIPSKETLDIVEFVPYGAIDPVYFDTPYFVAPDGKTAAESFTVIREALRAAGKIGLGQLAIAGRERLCAIQPYGSGLLMETLRYEEEIRETDPYFAEIGKHAVEKEQLQLAMELIKRKSAPFKPGKFHDHYREALQELIDAKVENRKPRQMMKEPKVAKVGNLMDALRRSLREDTANDNRPAKRKPAVKPAARKTPAKKIAGKRR